jgi:AI-2 transport system permease protein
MRARLRDLVGGRELTLLVACFVAGAVFAALSPYFFQIGNLATILRNSVELLLIGLGMSFVLAMGGIDVSVGVAMGIAAIGVGHALLAGVPPILAALVGPLVGLVLGVITGSVIVFGRIPAIVATVGLLGVYRTAVYALLGGSWLSGLPSTLGATLGFRFFGVVSVAALVIALLYLATYVALRWTPFGAHLLAIGQGEEKARLAGVAVRRTRFAGYVAAGVLCGVAASFYVGTYRNVEMTIGSTLSLDAVAAVVIGGTSILGGRASLLGTMLGVVLLRMLQNGFTLIGVPSLWQSVVTGLLLLSVLSLESAIFGGVLRRAPT